MRWWPATENILTANDTVVYKRQTSGVIVGIKENTVYALRVLGFNRGGDGKKSPTVYFTRGMSSVLSVFHTRVKDFL